MLKKAVANKVLPKALLNCFSWTFVQGVIFVLRFNFYVKILIFGNTQSEIVNGFLPKIKHSFLKIDVEGAELEVIEGLKNWINDHRPIMIAEVLPTYTADNTFRIERQNRIAVLVSEMNFVILRKIEN